MMISVPIWKEEPASPPPAGDEASLFDVATLYQTTPLERDDDEWDAGLSACETKAELASHILENLDNLMDLDDLIKDEPFLLDDKILPTILDAVETPGHPKPEYPQPPQDSHYLLSEFETIYSAVNMDHETLTPPQSPPGHHLTTLQPLTSYDVKPQVCAGQLLDGYLVELNYPTATVTPQPDIAHELAVVEELVRTRVQDMQWGGPGSPGSSSSNSSSNFEDSSSEDPEWVPEPVETLGLPPRKRSKGKPEEKRVRKKEQNKNAATRYRMKKKAEVEEILQEEKQVLSANTQLSEKITDLQREIKYLKGLMRELFKAKGLID